MVILYLFGITHLLTNESLSFFFFYIVIQLNITFQLCSVYYKKLSNFFLTELVNEYGSLECCYVSFNELDFARLSLTVVSHFDCFIASLEHIKTLKVFLLINCFSYALIYL
jgi:hypothetical protein